MLSATAAPVSICLSALVIFLVLDQAAEHGTRLHLCLSYGASPTAQSNNISGAQAERGPCRIERPGMQPAARGGGAKMRRPEAGWDSLTTASENRRDGRE